MKKQKNVPLIAAAAICMLSIVLMILVLAIPGGGPEPEFVPPPFEENALPGVPEVPDNLGWGEVNAKAFRASLCGVIIAEDGKADIWLTNPETNGVWLKLRVLDADGNILGETGILRPGEYVQSVALTKALEEGEAIGLKLMAYEPGTYYSAGSAVLNTTIQTAIKNYKARTDCVYC